MKLKTQWMITYDRTGRNDSYGGEGTTTVDTAREAIEWRRGAYANNEGTSYKTVNIRIFKVKELVE